MDPLHLIGYIIDLLLTIILLILSIFLMYKIAHTTYHVNLRISIINIYTCLPLLSIARIVMVINIFCDGAVVSDAWNTVARKLLRFSLTAMYFMQWPSMIDRFLATVFHKTYEHWNWYGTVGRVIVVWMFLVLLSLGLVPISSTVIIVVFGTSFVTYIAIYGGMFYTNIKRYRTSQKSPNLRERYQLAENMRSLYPLFWISIIEIFMNAASAIFVVVFYFTTHSYFTTNVSYNVGDPLISVFREVALIVYCLPFLVYSEKRRHRRFMNKINVQSQQEHDLYFKNLKTQWGIT